MPSPFSRTIRSINTDSFRMSVAGLAVALVILSAWMAWFFLARVSVYKVSPKAWVTGEETVTSQFFPNARRSGKIRKAGIAAQFPAGDLSDIRPGQMATLYLKGTGRVWPLPAKVTDVVSDRDQPLVRLSVRVNADSQAPLRKGNTGEVKIAVRHVSPAVMVMQASGLFADTPGISVGAGNHNGP